MDTFLARKHSPFSVNCLLAPPMLERRFTMLIYKTFQLPLAKEDAEKRLRQIGSYWRRFAAVEKALLTHDGQMRLRLQLPYGFRAECDIEELQSNMPFQTLFRTNRGNLEIVGVIDYTELEPSLTQVAVTINYTILPGWYQMLDYVTHCVNHFVGSQLDQLQGHLSKKGGVLGANKSVSAPINGHKHV